MVEQAEAHPQGLSFQLCLSSFVACHPLCFFTLRSDSLPSFRTSQPSHSQDGKKEEKALVCPLLVHVCELDRVDGNEQVVEKVFRPLIEVPIPLSQNTPLQVEVQHSKTLNRGRFDGSI